MINIRNSNKFCWKISVFLEDFVWFCYYRPILKLRASLALQFHHFKNSPILKKLIKDKRILIIGSGPSALELERIPEDAKVFTCNEGLKVFDNKKLEREIDLFLCYKSKMERRENIQKLVAKNKIKIFAIDDLGYVKNKKEFRNCYSKLIIDCSVSNVYLRRLIRPHTIDQIQGDSTEPRVSTGMRLLQYALYYKAKEIYLIGIDFGKDGYFWESDFNWMHSDIDENFLRIVAERHNNVFSLSKNSPITKYIRYKSINS